MTKSMKSTVVRLIAGALLHGVAYAGPATYLYSYEPFQQERISYMTSQPRGHAAARGTYRYAKSSGMPHLLNVGEGVISLNQ